LRRPALRRSIDVNNTSPTRVNMSNTRKISPLQSAIAAWTVLRVGLVSTGRTDMAQPTVPFPIYRGLTR